MREQAVDQLCDYNHRRQTLLAALLGNLSAEVTITPPFH